MAHLFATTAPSVPGDLNADGKVDLNDYEILKGEWLQHGAALPADLNHDGTIDVSDFSLFKADYQAFNGGGQAELPASVPEPSSLALLLLAGVAGFARGALRQSRRPCDDPR